MRQSNNLENFQLFNDLGCKNFQQHFMRWTQILLERSVTLGLAIDFEVLSWNTPTRRSHRLMRHQQ